MKNYNKTIDERGEAAEQDWDKLADYMDEHNFSNQDFLACICANLVNNNLNDVWPEKFTTKIEISGVLFDISIKPSIYKPNNSN